MIQSCEDPKFLDWVLDQSTHIYTLATSKSPFPSFPPTISIVDGDGIAMCLAVPKNMQLQVDMFPKTVRLPCKSIRPVLVTVLKLL